MSDINDPNSPPAPPILIPNEIGIPATSTAPKPEPAEPAQKTTGMIRGFYDDLVMSLTEPRQFYTERYPQLSFNYALAFGLIVNWLAATLKWLTRVLNHETFFDGFLRIRDRLQQLPIWKDLPPSIWAQSPTSSVSLVPSWIAEAASVALHPFSFLLNIVITAVALTLGGYLFLPRHQEGIRDKADISHFMKLAALASTPALVGAVLSFLPLGLGSFISVVYWFCMLLFAVSIRYRVSRLRSFAILMAPWMTLGLVGTCFVGLFGAIIFGFIASLFGLS